MVERPTEKPGAILTRVRVPDAARDFSPRVSFQCRLTYGVRAAPGCNRMHHCLCARQKSQTLAAVPLLGQTKILYALIGMSSAALAAAVHYPGKATRISCKGQKSTIKNNNIYIKIQILRRGKVLES